METIVCSFNIGNVIFVALYPEKKPGINENIVTHVKTSYKLWLP